MAIAERGVGCSELPVLILNTSGYYDGSIAQLQAAHDKGMLRKHWTEYVDVVETPEAAVAWCLKQKRRAHTPSAGAATDASAPSYLRGLLHGVAIGSAAVAIGWLVSRR